MTPDDPSASDPASGHVSDPVSGPAIDPDAAAVRNLTGRLERLAAETAVRGDRLLTLSLENAGLKREIDARFAELAELTRRLTEANRLLAETNRGLVETDQRLIKAEEALVLEGKLRKQAEAYAEDVTSSSVWRLTGPLRQIVGRMLGRG